MTWAALPAPSASPPIPATPRAVGDSACPRREALLPVSCWQATAAPDLVRAHQVRFCLLPALEFDALANEEARMLAVDVKLITMLGADAIELANDRSGPARDERGQGVDLVEMVAGRRSRASAGFRPLEEGVLPFGGKHGAIDE